ncbi:secretion protein HlyD [Sinorhizobium sp. BG8]|uniref:secretion protein HlyD n=1 Tax=Sinorhizobium sp. BG8 TaxID=2613773 RepID=UPI00193EC125|nr:secretion protein HlyD [Sinorhizobium sp. BG8]QRM54182.1 secretion protein HlyD [Sinorhizobium sp. BG8]
MKLFVPAVLLAAVAAGTAWWYDVPQKLGLMPQQTNELRLYGNVDIRQVSLGFRVSGRVSETAVDEGDTVKAGAVVARLDAAPHQAAVRAAEAEVGARRATLQKLRAGARATEIAQARAQYNETLADLENAELDLDRAKRLGPSGTISQSTLDRAVAGKASADARAESAREALKLLEEGSRAEDIAAAESDLGAAEAALASAKISLDDTELKAPSDGVILSRVREMGAIVAPSDTVLVLSLNAPVWVRAYVGETNLGRVHPGMKVEITSDSSGAKRYSGTVGFISPVAEFTPKSVETPELRTDLVYRLRIIVTDADAALRQGMPVSIHLPSPEVAER